MSETTMTIERGRRGQFVSGHKCVSPGRPKGARDRHSRNFLTAMADDFEQHGAAVIAKVREEQPAVWLRIAADLLPRHAELDVSIDVMHDVTNVLEGYRTLSDMLGADPALGMRRLKRLAPGIIDVKPD